MKGEKKFQLSNVITISLAHLFHDTYSSFLAPILPILIDKLGISLFLSGLLDVFRRLPSLANPFVGIIADKVSVRYFIILAPLITTTCMSLLGLANSYLMLAILLFVAGISSTLFHVPAPVMIKEVSGNRIGKGMSFYMLGGEIARTLGPLTILAAVSWWKLEGTYRLMPLGFLASTILFFKLRKVKLENYRLNQKKKSKAHHVFISLLPFFLTVAGIVAFRSAMKMCLTMFLPTYLTEKGSTLWVAGISLSILQFSGAIGTFFAGSVSDRISRRTSLLIIAIANPILMWLFIISNGFFSFVILLIMGFFLFAAGPVLLALVHDIKSEHPSFVNGTYMTINFLISSIMVLVVGFLGDKFQLQITFKICAILSLGSIPFVFLLPTKNAQKSLKVDE